MKRWLFILLAMAISTGVYFTIRFGLRPKPIPVMNPTQFEQMESIGVVIYKRLRQNIRSERILLLGSNPEIPESDQVWLGLLKAALNDRQKIVLFSTNTDTTSLLPGSPTAPWEKVVLNETGLRPSELAKQIKARLDNRQLVVVQASTRVVTHLVAGSLSRELDRVVQHPVLSLSIMPFSVEPAGPESVQVDCLDGTVDPDGDSRLLCAAQRVAKRFQRKSLDPAQTWAVMERHGLKEYLLFIHRPRNNP